MATIRIRWNSPSWNANPFYAEDHTGRIKVVPKGLSFVDMPVDEQYQSNNKRYTQYLLTEGMEVLMVGRASVAENNEPVFEHEPVKNVFGVALVESVRAHNNWRPLGQSAMLFAYFWLVLIALILLTPVELRNGVIEFGKIQWQPPFLR